MKIKRDKRDILFSMLVRERAEWACERCTTYFSEGNRSGLECSHFFTRSRKSGRWNPLAAAAHCTGCHKELGSNPIQFHRWILAHLGPKKTSQVEALSAKIIHLKKHHKEEIHANLKASWEDMQARRKAGETGRIEFDDPMPDDIL